VQERTTVSSGIVRLAVRQWVSKAPSAGPDLLLLHGLASTSHIFDLVAPLLAARSRVIALDQRGHGESGKPSSGYGFDRVTTDAVAVMDALGLTRPVVLGHSWGANVALELAVQHPRRLTGAVMLDGGFGSLRGRMDWRTTREVLAPPRLSGMRADEFLALARQLMAGSIELTPEIEAIFLSLMRVDREGRIHPKLSRGNHLRILHAIWQHDPEALLRQVETPVLVLATRPRDPRPDEAEFLESKRKAAVAIRAMKGPVRFEWIEGIHDIPIQRPKALAARIGRFIEGIGPGTSSASRG
jgi:pimeloyl-ACP methyl ester carboxylesterase